MLLILEITSGVEVANVRDELNLLSDELGKQGHTTTFDEQPSLWNYVSDLKLTLDTIDPSTVQGADIAATLTRIGSILSVIVHLFLGTPQQTGALQPTAENLNGIP